VHVTIRPVQSLSDKDDATNDNDDTTNDNDDTTNDNDDTNNDNDDTTNDKDVTNNDNDDTTCLEMLRSDYISTQRHILEKGNPQLEDKQ
jgi:hypothetical protein